MISSDNPLWDNTEGESFGDKLKTLLMRLNIHPTANAPFVNRESVFRLITELEEAGGKDFDKWLEKGFGPEPCPDCMHPAHANTECGEFVGYDHLNGDHECGCLGEQRCDFDCSYCNPEDEPDWYDTHDAITDEPIKSDICTCLMPDGAGWCDVHEF